MLMRSTEKWSAAKLLWAKQCSLNGDFSCRCGGSAASFKPYFQAKCCLTVTSASGLAMKNGGFFQTKLGATFMLKAQVGLHSDFKEKPSFASTFSQGKAALHRLFLLKAACVRARTGTIAEQEVYKQTSLWLLPSWDCREASAGCGRKHLPHAPLLWLFFTLHFCSRPYQKLVPQTINV